MAVGTIIETVVSPRPPIPVGTSNVFAGIKVRNEGRDTETFYISWSSREVGSGKSGRWSLGAGKEQTTGVLFTMPNTDVYIHIDLIRII